MLPFSKEALRRSEGFKNIFLLFPYAPTRISKWTPQSDVGRSDSRSNRNLNFFALSRQYLSKIWKELWRYSCRSACWYDWIKRRKSSIDSFFLARWRKNIWSTFSASSYQSSKPYAPWRSYRLWDASKWERKMICNSDALIVTYRSKKALTCKSSSYMPKWKYCFKKSHRKKWRNTRKRANRWERRKIFAILDNTLTFTFPKNI